MRQIDDNELQRVFSQLGMASSSDPRGLDPRKSDTLDPRGKDPRKEFTPAAFRQYQGQDPQILERQGPLRMFLHGMGSPVTATLSKLGVIEYERPKPQTLGEGLSYGAGAMLTFAGLLLPKIGPLASLAAAKAVGAVGVAGKGAALATSLGKSGMIAGTMGAHRAWTEDKPIGQEVMKSMAWGIGLGATFHGIGAGLKYAGVIKPGAGDYLTRAKGEILSITAPKTIAESRSFGKLLEMMPGGKVSAAKDTVVQNILARKGLNLPSHVLANDVGLRVGPYWDSWKPEKQVRALMSAFKHDKGFDSMFKPVMDLASATKLTSMPFRGQDLQQIKHIISGTKKLDVGVIDTAGMKLPGKAKEAVRMISEGRDFGEQWKGYTVLKKSLAESNKSILKKYEVKNFSELIKQETWQKLGIGEFKTRVKDFNQWSNDIDRYANNHSLLQDMSWKIGDRIQSVMNRDPNIALPSIKQVNSRILSTAYEQSAKLQLQASSQYPQARVQYHPYLEKILDKVNGGNDRKVNYWYQLSKESRTEWDAVVKQLTAKGEPVRVFYRGGGSPPLVVPAEVSSKMAAEYFAKPETPIRVPASFTSMAEAEMLQAKPLPFIGTHLTPIWRLFGKGFASEGRIATKADATFRDDWLGKNEVWMKTLGVKGKELTKAGEKIGKILEADVPWVPAKDVGAAKKFIAEFMKVGKLKETSPKFQAFAQKVGLAPKELKVAYEMKKSFDELFKASGLDPERYITAYLPHARKLHGQDYQRVVSDMKLAGLSMDEIRGYRWVHGMAREEGAMMNYTKDAFRAYTQYVTGLSKKIHYDKFFQHWDTSFKKVGMSEERRAVFVGLKDAIMGHPTPTERMSDQMIQHLAGFLGQAKSVGPRPTAQISSLLAELQYMGGIGANPFTVVKNLTQKMLAMTNITDSGDPLEGLYWIGKAKFAKATSMGRAILQHDTITPDRIYLESLGYQRTAMQNMLKKFPFLGEGAAKVYGKLDKAAFHFFKWSDKDNVQDTFLAKTLYLMEKKGAPFADAVELATTTTMATQFMYGFDSPMLYKGAIGRQLGIFMSWPLNWAQMLYEQGTTGDMHRALATVATMAVGVELLNMTGMNFRSVHPVNVARGMLPIAMIEGEDSWPLSLRTASAGLEYMRAVASQDPVAMDLTFERFKQRLRPMIPLGIAGGRIISFVDVMQNEWKKYDKLDRLRHPVAQSEAIRSLIGPTNEAFKRVEEWQMVSEMDSHYRRTRRMAIESFLDNDYQKFERLQEQMVVNFGKWITPHDIRQELELRQMTARERQLKGLPASIRDPFLASRGY